MSEALPDQPPVKAPQGRSLKGRALAFLSRREHSRVELAKKLAPHAESPEQLEQLLDALERDQWLSTPRFAESVIHRKSAKLGNARLLQELRQHQVDEQTLATTAASIKETEAERALALWLRKFGQTPTDAKDYARQMRFLLSRGFPAGIVQKILGRMSFPTHSHGEE